MQKTYLLDTNILMQTEGKALYGFEDNIVCITTTSLEELDGLKKAPGEVGFEAREAIRTIFSIYENKGEKDVSLTAGINLPNQGIFKLIATNPEEYNLPKGWSSDKPDNQILGVAKMLSKKANTNLILITNDISMLIKAQVIGITTQQYKNDQVSADNKYTGRRQSIVETSLIDFLYKSGSLFELPEEYEENEYVCLSDGNKSALAVHKRGTLKLLKDIKDPVFGIIPKNQGQRFLMDALCLPPEEISLVICNGVAGCGKTLLSVAAGLDKTIDKHNKQYDRIIITRSNTICDEDMGYLPGTLEDKMMPLLAPFMDNLLYLMNLDENDLEYATERVHDLLSSKIIEICSLSYIRGRSLPHSYIIIDEAQNLTRLQAKTIVTRAGVGSKVIFLGDMNQIDNPKLDKKNNGLAYLSEKFRGSPLCAQIDFKTTESVRSPLAIEAISRLE